MCGWPNCAQLARLHVYGDATCKLPEDEAQCREFLRCLQTPVEKHDAIVRRRCDNHEDVRYRQFHHHRIDRQRSKTGLPTVKIGETNFRDDKRRGRIVSPQPKRPRTGALGVAESPNLKSNPAAAMAARSVAKARREAALPPEFDPAGWAGTAMPAASPKATARRDAGYFSPDQKDGIDPRQLKAGTFLCTFDRLNALIQMCDTHNRSCAGTLSFRPSCCKFNGVVAQLRPECFTCGRKSWDSSPVFEEVDPPRDARSDPTVRKSFFLNELVSHAMGTTPVGIEAGCYFLEGLHLRVPNKCALYQNINGPVADAVASTWDEEQGELLSEIHARSDHPHLLASLDGSHTGGSDAEVSRVNCIEKQSEKESSIAAASSS